MALYGKSLYVVKSELIYDCKMSFLPRVGVAAAGGVALLLLLDLLLVSALPADARAWYGIVVRITLYGLAAIAAGMAAARFAWWHEHIGRAWALFSLEFVLLLINYILRRATPGGMLALNITLIAANVAQIAAYSLMARVLTAAGIGYLISRAKRVVLTAAALAVAILLCHGSLLTQWQLIRSGNVQPGSLISVLADVITFTLVAPLAMSTFALRGGQLSWIFGFLTISVFGWMINTGAPSIAGTLGGGADVLRSIRMAGVAIASLFNAAAAAAQSLAAHRAMKGSGIDG
jgi:hypothetical protein